jgi:hypothetical protein
LPLRAKAEQERRRRIEAGARALGAAVWQPDPDNQPQINAYRTPAFETLYGGAAGGGKSDLLLGLARTAHQRALLLRRTFPELERSLITRSLEFYGDSKLYNAAQHVWKVDGRRIEFGHMEAIGTPAVPRDEAKYASAPYDLIGIDQLEQFPQYGYTFMLSRVRTTVPGQRTRIVATANPVGENIGWIIERWAPWLDELHPWPARAGDLRYFKRDAQGKEVETTADDPDAMSRTFIPAALKDNRYLGDEYRRTLNLLPEPLRSALLNGDWNASLVEDAYQVLPRAWVKLAQARWREDGHPKDMEGRALRLSCLGADIARGGDDQEVLAPRYGNWIAPLVKIPGAHVPDGATSVKPILEYLETNGEAVRTGREIEYPDAGFMLPVVQSKVPVNIDVIGVGSSTYDTSRAHGLNAVPINWASGSHAFDESGTLQFVNKRAEHWWKTREALDPKNGQEIALPPDSELLADLCAPRWESQKAGIKIESKEDIKKRIGRSPDCGDAVVMALADEAVQILFGA